jgi:signal transduction histidine kinase/CheY-like chemotaxis protein
MKIRKRTSVNIIYILFILSFTVMVCASFYAKYLIDFTLRTMEYNIEQRLIMISERASGLASAAELDRYRTVRDMSLPSYQELRRKLRDFSKRADVLYVYYIRLAGEGELQYIVDNDFNEETRVGLDTKPYSLASAPWIYGALEGRTVCSGLGNYTPGWEGILTVYSPVFDGNGKVAAVAGVDIQDKPIVQARRAVSVLSVVQIVTVFLIFVCGMIFLIRSRLQAAHARKTRGAEDSPFPAVSIKKNFFAFSVIFFLMILVEGSAAFFFTTRELGDTRMENALTLALEAQRLRIANAVNSDLGLVLKLADDPLIKRHLLDPRDPELREQAFEALASYRRNFKNNTIFWISDADRMFHFNDAAPYALDPGKPVNYWYNLTLRKTELYNFNINHNPDISVSNLWLNAPVLENGKAVGMVGTGIDLVDLLISLNSPLARDMETYFFNTSNEITVARDPTLALEKKNIVDLLGPAGESVAAAARAGGGTKISIISLDDARYAVSSIPMMNWFVVVRMPAGAATLFDPTLTAVFCITVGLVFTIFYVSQKYIGTIQATVDEQNRSLTELKDIAEAANRSKNDFLADISHEIRTPMNAISGMTELLLRRELDDECKGYVRDIKHASSNLLAIINDLLDFSKIEAGHLELVSDAYHLPTLVNDVADMFRLRIMEKPIRFYTNVDASIPCMFIGDETRLRQILINLVSNAVKFTEKGFITLSVTRGAREGAEVPLRLAVEDSGIGIRSEDLRKLFDAFVQVDIKRHRGIEGTGLGLAIAKRLCEAMGGEISVESAYGKGSVFTVVIPQEIFRDTPFAAVNDPGEKKTLIYESRRRGYAKSAAWSLENMGVPCRLATSVEDVAQALREEEWRFLFSGCGLYRRDMAVMERLIGELPAEKRPHLVLMSEWGDDARIPDARFVCLSAQTLSIANALNGMPDCLSDMRKDGFRGPRIIAPDARFLVVDDMTTNLKVAVGLIAPYKARVDTCPGGAEAVDLVKRNAYDIVFMDHMMPDMDGMEATALIREWERAQGRRPIPIVALTANAMVGMREMFAEKGFNDFLAKPVDVSKLDAIIEKWIPEEKRMEKNGSPRSVKTAGIPGALAELESLGLDVRGGIVMTGGTPDGYKRVLSIFREDVEARLPLLRTPPERDALLFFTTQVHALKSASANIGAVDISAEAARLEAAGKAGDLAAVRESLPGFAQRLAELVRGINAAPASRTDDGAVGDARETAASPPDFGHSPLLRELSGALKAGQVGVVGRLLRELDQKPLDAKTREALESISDRVLTAEFDAAAEIVAALTDGGDKRP